MISEKIEPLRCIFLESSHKVWKDGVFHLPKNIIPMDNEIIEQSIQQVLFQAVYGPYRNAHFFIPTKNEKYCLIMYAMSTNWHTLDDGWIPHNVKEFPKAFAGLPISSLIDFDSGYNQNM